MMICFRKRMSPEEMKRVSEALADLKKLRMKYFFDEELRNIFDFSGTKGKLLTSTIDVEVKDGILDIKVKNYNLRNFQTRRDTVMYALLERLQALNERYNYSFEHSLAYAYMFKPAFFRRKINRDYERCQKNFMTFTDLVRGDQMYYF